MTTTTSTTTTTAWTGTMATSSSMEEARDGDVAWPADLAVIAPEPVAAGFRLAGVRTVVADGVPAALVAIEAELDRAAPGVVAVEAVLWRDLPPSTRTALEESTRPLVLSLPDPDAEAARSRRDRIREALARSVGYEITFTSEGNP